MVANLHNQILSGDSFPSMPAVALQAKITKEDDEQKRRKGEKKMPVPLEQQY